MKETPLRNSIRNLDLKLDTMQNRPVSSFKAGEQRALLQMARKVVEDYYRENGDERATATGTETTN